MKIYYGSSDQRVSTADQIPSKSIHNIVRELVEKVEHSHIPVTLNEVQSHLHIPVTLRKIQGHLD